MNLIKLMTLTALFLVSIQSPSWSEAQTQIRDIEDVFAELLFESFDGKDISEHVQYEMWGDVMEVIFDDSVPSHVMNEFEKQLESRSGGKANVSTNANVCDTPF